MTDDLQAQIDAMSLEDLLRTWRYAPVGDRRFQGEAGQYVAARLAALRRADPDAWVRASQRIGWER